jgi:hypothetical protein
VESVSTETLKLINALLPGFLAAWIFYGLTPHPKQTPFERTVQALIFTAIIRVLTWMMQLVGLLLGKRWAISLWTADVDLFWSVIIAAAVGIGFSYCSNNNILHKWLISWGVTKRHSLPSEWYSALSKDERYVILHLEGNRRLHGFPIEYPDQSDSGHFVLVYPQWLLGDNECIPLTHVERMLVPAKSVEMVEIMKSAAEVQSEDTA